MPSWTALTSLTSYAQLDRLDLMLMLVHSTQPHALSQVTIYPRTHAQDLTCQPETPNCAQA